VDQNDDCVKLFIHTFLSVWTEVQYHQLYMSMNSSVIQAVQPVTFLHTRHAHRSVLQSVAREIVERQPVSSADNINGKKVDDEVNSIMMMLESKKNLNHRLQSLVSLSL